MKLNMAAMKLPWTSIKCENALYQCGYLMALIFTTELAF